MDAILAKCRMKTAVVRPIQLIGQSARARWRNRQVPVMVMRMRKGSTLFEILYVHKFCQGSCLALLKTSSAVFEPSKSAVWLLKNENLTTKALSKSDGEEEGPLFQKIGGCRQHAWFRLTVFCRNSLGQVCGLRGAVVSVVAFWAKGRGFKSTHGCSHTMQKPSISPRLFGQCTLIISLPRRRRPRPKSRKQNNKQEGTGVQ